MATTALNEPTAAGQGSIPFVGTSANDSTGDTLRAAIQFINARLKEIYGSQNSSNVVQTPFIDTDNIKDDNVTPAKINVLQDDVAATNNHILVADGTDFANVAVSGDVTISNTGAVTIGSDAVTYDKIQDTTTANRVLGAVSAGTVGEVQVATDMIADDAVNPSKINILQDDVAATDTHILVADGTDFANVAVSGDATISNTGALTVANDAITHDKLEDRYTAVGSIANTQGATTVNWNKAVYKMDSALDGAIEFDFTNYKAGQVLTIYNISGSQTITLDSDASTSESFLKVGGVDYDGSAASILQVECLADGNDAVFAYSIAQTAPDTTP